MACLEVHPKIFLLVVLVLEMLQSILGGCFGTVHMALVVTCHSPISPIIGGRRGGGDKHQVQSKAVALQASSSEKRWQWDGGDGQQLTVL